MEKGVRPEGSAKREIFRWLAVGAGFLIAFYMVAVEKNATWAAVIAGATLLLALR